MAGFANLKKVITDNIKPNDKNEITGQVLQDVLVTFVNSLNGRQFVGIATPTTNPGKPDGNVFYIATEAGTYTYFGGAKIDAGNIVILTNDSTNSWRTYILLTYTPSGDPMHYAYVACGATWNDSTGYWELNGLTDITNDQMRTIYVYGIGCWNKSDWRGAYSNSPVRTTLPSPSNDGITFSGVAIDGCFVSCRNIEIVQFLQNAGSTIRIGSNLYYSFVNCNALTSIVNPIDVTFVTQGEMARTVNFGCPNCTTLKLKSVKYNTYLGQMAAISLDSLTYLVNNASNSGAITVTVHPTIYGYLTDQSGHADWYALAQTAAGKNISFASA